MTRGREEGVHGYSKKKKKKSTKEVFDCGAQGAQVWQVLQSC